jgi:hypothetical protein
LSAKQAAFIAIGDNKMQNSLIWGLTFEIDPISLSLRLKKAKARREDGRLKRLIRRKNRKRPQ